MKAIPYVRSALAFFPPLLESHMTLTAPPHQVNEIVIDYTQCINQVPGAVKVLDDSEYRYTFTSPNTTGRFHLLCLHTQ